VSDNKGQVTHQSSMLNCLLEYRLLDGIGTDVVQHAELRMDYHRTTGFLHPVGGRGTGPGLCQILSYCVRANSYEWMVPRKL
jgi:hypothetical protein